MMAKYARAVLHWRGEQYTREIRERMKERLLVVASYLETKVKENISVPAPPPSQPGEYPHLDEGELRASVQTKTDLTKLKVYVFADAPYAMAVELGTHWMAARSYLRRTLYEEKVRVRAEMVKPIPDMRGHFRLYS